MGFELTLPPKKNYGPESVAHQFCDEIRRNFCLLRTQTFDPEKLKKMKLLLARDKYHRDRGNGYCNRLVKFADRVSYKVLEIVSSNPEDWNNHRRGQQFRRLDELLTDFEVEWFRSRYNPDKPENSCLFGHRRETPKAAKETNSGNRIA